MSDFSSNTCAFLLMDVQEKLFQKIHHKEQLLSTLKKALLLSEILDIPVISVEQYPKGLGATIKELKRKTPLEKTTFSCWKEEKIQKAIKAIDRPYWILLGIETHICVLQTAKDLLLSQRKVLIPQDGVGACSPFEHTTALTTLQQLGALITSMEALAFELVEDAKNPSFKEVQKLFLT